jgi:hypothetical protein
MLMLSACSNYNGTPVDAYQHWRDRAAILFGLADLHAVWPCMRKEKVTGHVAMFGALPDDQCYKMEPQRRWRGLLRRTEDGDQFCPAAAKECWYHSSDERTWLYWKTADVMSALGRLPGPGLYYVDLIGRRTAIKGSYGYGAYDREIVVDRLSSLKQLKGPLVPEDQTLK